MTVKEIFDLRKQGRIEEAYEAIRPMYRVHKGHYTSLCMYLCARDVFNIRLAEGRLDEASKIYLALQRLVPFIGDKDGTVSKFMSEANARLNALRSAMPYKGNITETGSALMTAPTGQNTLAQGLAPGDVEMPPSEPCRGDITPPRVLTLGIPDSKIQTPLGGGEGRNVCPGDDGRPKLPLSRQVPEELLVPCAQGWPHRNDGSQLPQKPETTIPQGQRGHVITL